MNPNSGRKKWVITIVIAAILIAAAVAVAIFAGPKPENPVVEKPAESPLGVYYYDTAEGEYLLTLSQGNVFMISGPSLNKSGKCVVTDNGIELDFVKDEDGTGSLKEENGVMILQYKDKTMRFLEKKTFKVNFNVNGGSEVAAIDVTNGKTVAKPADPKKDGSVFIGWYADSACTQLYGFGNEVITADTTVYAKWAETVVGQNEYTVNFDLGYEAEGYAAMSTIGGKLYNVPTPARDGFTFAGWWVSMTENAEELTIPYVEDMVFQANTTLFALWTTTPEGGKLAAPMVEVYADSIKWNTIQGTSTYELKIFDANGVEIHSEKLGATTKTFDFATREAGEYTIQVTALASVEDKNSETTTRTFVNKALDRVSLFTVIDGGILLWNNVEGAEKYLITIDCGNDAHKHTAFDNGDSTTFMFKNCAMQEGGIKFTVTAVADGKASSVSETFVYDRKLDAVGEILYNEETQSFYWDAVANAAKYSITVKVGNKTFTIDNGSATTFSAKYLSGDITLEIVPMTQGYNSPEATTTTYKKTSLATPDGLMAKGNILTWNAVEGATGYMVKINNQSFQAETNSLDLNSTTLNLDSSTTYDICVMAVGAESSLYSDMVTMKYLAPIEQVTYKNNTVTWTPVMGVENYEVRVNGGEAITVSGRNNVKVELTKAGINVIEVRYTDMGGSVWTKTEVFAYEVIYNSRSLSGTKSEFLAMGDTMSLPETFTQDGYDFSGWYNAPEAANGNGAACADTTFTGTGTTILYANWTPKTYYVTFKGMTGVTNMAEDDQQAVVYQDGYKLPIPEANDEMGEFMGWYTGPGGSGVVLTDAKGNCLRDYEFTRDAIAYPAFNNGVLEYILQSDGTYAVTAGPNIVAATTITIPEYYKNVAVTTILENAFYNATTIEKIVIPATIRTIGVGAIPNTKALKEIAVYTDTIQQNYEVFYSSHDGALLRHDMGTIYLEAFPRGKTGEYTIPDDVDVIRDKVFRYSKITKLTVGNGVTMIMRNAFYSCAALEVLEFKGEGTEPLTIDPEAFYLTTNLSILRLPARLAETNLQMLNGFVNLVTLEVEAGGMNYSSVDNMICNAVGNAILFVPTGLEGEYEIPKGIREIGPMAFANRPGLTKVTIPNYVNKIGEAAFVGCTGITEVVIEGSRSNDLLIDEMAFFGCDEITAVTFRGNGTATADAGITTIGTGAFEGIKQLKAITFEAGTNIVIGERAFAGNEKLYTLTYAEGSTIQRIGKEAFADCILLTEAIIPATTTAVDDGAFSGCEGILNVTFQSRETSIAFGSNVFAGCKKLTTVNLPASLDYFDGSVFSGCDAITQIIVDEANQDFVTYGGALYSKNYEEILFYPRNLDGDLTKLHPDLKKIGANVFQDNPRITKVNLGKNIVAIGDYAFQNCYNLAEVTFEEGGAGMTIGAGAFASCGLLTGIELPACTTEIGESAFEDAGLTAFVIPEQVAHLKQNVLKNTKITEINIPANVETIGDGAFANTKLVTVTFAEGTKPLTLGTLENSDQKNGVFYNTKIVEITFGDRVTLIGAYAFYNQTTLTTATMNPDSQVTQIGKYAFAVESGTSKLKTLTLGGKLETIYDHAFFKSKVSKITIPKTVALIDGYAFANTSMSGLIFEQGGIVELTIGTQAFASSTFAEVTLPARLQSAYYLYDFNGAAQFKVFDIFKSNSRLKNIHVEAGGEYFASKDGVLYEVNADGVADTLLFCPSAKTGDLTIPKEIRMVENGAFVNTSLSNVSFEEYPKDHEGYGKPWLEIGNGVMNKSGTPAAQYAVFTSSKAVNINLPSHLKAVGIGGFFKLSNKKSTVNFNMDARVKHITGSAFYNSSIVSVSLPAVEELHYGVFYNCKNLTSVTFHTASSFGKIPASMFYGCQALTAVEIPANVTKIEKQAFNNCKALENVTFAEGSQLKEIGDDAFRRSAFVEFVMPKTVEIIGSAAFGNCPNLKTITLSENLVNILVGTYTPFYQSAALEHIIVPEKCSNFKSVDGVLYDLAETIIYCFPQGKDPTGFKLPDTLITIEQEAFYGFRGTNLELPESVERIAKMAFANTRLTSIHIPKNVISIGKNAFYVNVDEDLSLESVTFATDSKLETIENNAFAYNPRLSSINLPDSVKTINNYAFRECYGLEEVVLPAALTVLEGNVFQDCYNIKKIVMQEGLTEIGQYAIAANEDIPNMVLTELVIPSTVTSIGGYAFRRLSALETVTFAEGSQLNMLDCYVFSYCVKLQSITLPGTLKTVKTKSTSTIINDVKLTIYKSGLFENCESLKYVDMSACEELTEIPTDMFVNCTSVETLLLPPNLVTIHDFAFGGKTEKKSSVPVYCAGLTSLKEIEIPATVTHIGGYAFNDCKSLETVIFAADNAITELGVEERSANNYFAGTHIFANTPALKTVELPKNLMLIGISCFENSGVKDIELPSSLREIGGAAFKNCDNITEVTLSENVQVLGDEAFYDCDQLAVAQLSFGLEYLGSLSFAYCEQLKEAYIPATVTKIPGNPFLGCTGVQNFELSQDSVDFTVKDGVLYDKTMYTLIYYPASLTAETFEIPETVHEIGAGAFAGAQLKHFVIPERFHEIPDYAFQASALESITFHRGVTTIGNYAFEGCKNLNDVTMLNSIKHSGNYVFANCTGLTNFVFEEMPENVAPYTIGTHFFDGCTAITQVILPNRMSITDEDEDQVSKIINKEAVIPSYMFANTGIVHAVIPGQITELSTLGVFYNCKQLETVTYVNKDYDSYEVGAYTFYGCSKLKELEIPTGFTNPITQYAFAECTSLEKMTIYTTGTWISPRANGFVGCTNLKSIDVMLVGSFVRDENGMAVEYANVTKDYLYSVNNESFAGMPNMKYLYLGHGAGGSVYTNAFVGSSIEKLVIKRLNNFGGAPIDTPFAGENALKEIWIGGEGPNGMRIQQTTFTKLTHDINIYFCNHTLEEVIAMTGSDKWYTDADEKAHFYFKDTMPANVEWPEELKPTE